MDDFPPHPNLALCSHSNPNSFVNDVPSLDYEVEELTWENGEQAMHGLGPLHLLNNKPLSNSSPTQYTWDHHKPQVGGTLESIVNQATGIPHHRPKSPVDDIGGDRGDELMSWFDTYIANTMTRYALVPSYTNTQNSHQRVAPSTHVPSISGTCLVGCPTHVSTCSGAINGRVGEIVCDKMGADNGRVYKKRGHSNIVLSTSKDEPTERFTSTYMVDDHDPVFQSRSQGEVEEEDNEKQSKVSSSTKRRRVAIKHNKSERKRRDKINQRMKALLKLVPNSSETNKALMLDEVIEYMRQLQAQVQAMSNTMMYPMMLPVAVQQQLQMSMMAPAMRMRMVALTRPNATATPVVLHPTTSFMPITSAVSPRGRVNVANISCCSKSFIYLSITAYLGFCASELPCCYNQSSKRAWIWNFGGFKPMNMDAYSKMGALYEQYFQPSSNLGPRI